MSAKDCYVANGDSEMYKRCDYHFDYCKGVIETRKSQYGAVQSFCRIAWEALNKGKDTARMWPVIMGERVNQ